MTKAKLKARVARLKALKDPMRPIDQELANERELSAKVMENAGRFRERYRAFRDKKAYAPPRRDPIADRDIFEEIQRSLRAGHVVRLTGRKPPLVTGGEKRFTTTTVHRLIKEERARIKLGQPIGVILRSLPVHINDWDAIATVDRARRGRGELEKVVWAPRWQHTGPLLKGLAWAMVLYERGALPMSLHIAPSVIEAARRDARGFAGHMRERLKRELAAVSKELGCGPVSFFLVIEATEVGEPHLHGAITVPDGERARKLVRDALYLACFGRGDRKRTGREVDLKDYTTPAVWANYTAKWFRGSQDRIEGRAFAASTDLRAAGKEWYERMRETEAPLAGHEPEEADLLAAL